MISADELKAPNAHGRECFTDTLTFLPNGLEKLICPAWRPNFLSEWEGDTTPYGVSIVTAFFDLGRSEWHGEISGRPIHGSQRRSNEQYDEQTAMVMAHRRAPNLFRINKVDPSDWFSVLRRYLHVDTAPKPLASFVKGKGRSDVLTAARELAEGGIFVEVGTFKGDFAERLVTLCEPQKLYCVDPYESYADYQDTINTRMPLDAIYRDARARMARFGNRVEFTRAYSVEAAENFSDGSVDFVYIDANHAFQYVNQDLRAWYPKLKAGGLICGHDALDTDERARNAEGNIEIAWERDSDGTVTSGEHYGVLKAVKTFCSEHGIEFVLSGTQFLIQKKG